MNRAQRYFKASAAVFAARLSNLLGNLALVIWVSRSMGVEAFGSYSAALGLFTMFQVAAALGFENLILREVGRDPKARDRIFNHSGLIATGAALILTFVMASLAPALNYTPTTVVATWIISSALLPTGLISVLEALFIGLGRAEIVSVVYGVEVVGRLLATAVALSLGAGVLTIVGVYAGFRWLAFLLFAGFYVRAAGRPRWHIDPDYFRAFSSQLWTFSLITILSSLLWNVDIIMLSIFQNEYQLGVYNAAHKLVLVWSIVPISYMSVALPVLSRSHVHDPAKFSDVTVRSLRYLLAIALPLALGITIFGDRIILSLYGSDFADSIPILRWLGWLLLPFFLNNVLYRVLLSTNRQHWTLRVTSFSLMVNVGLSLLLVPAYGAVGAAVASLGAVCSSCALNALLIIRLQLPVRFPVEAWRFLVAAGVAALLGIWLGSGWSWLLAGLLFFGAYTLASIAVRAIGPSDWLLIRRLLQRPVVLGRNE